MIAVPVAWCGAPAAATAGAPGPPSRGAPRPYHTAALRAFNSTGSLQSSRTAVHSFQIVSTPDAKTLHTTDRLEMEGTSSTAAAPAGDAVTIADLRGAADLSAFFSTVPLANSVGIYSRAAAPGKPEFAVVVFGSGISPVVIAGEAVHATTFVHDCVLIFANMADDAVVADVEARLASALSPRTPAGVDLHVVQYMPDVLAFVVEAAKTAGASALQLEATLRATIVAANSIEQHICALPSAETYAIGVIKSTGAEHNLVRVADEAVRRAGGGTMEGAFTTLFNALLGYDQDVLGLEAARASVKFEVCRGACDPARGVPAEDIEHHLARAESHGAIARMGPEDRRRTGASDKLIDAYRYVHAMRSTWIDMPPRITQALLTLPENAALRAKVNDDQWKKMPVSERVDASLAPSAVFFERVRAKFLNFNAEYERMRAEMLKRALREVCNNYLDEEFRAGDDFNEKLSAGLARISELQKRAEGTVKRVSQRDFLVAEYRAKADAIFEDLRGAAETIDRQFQSEVTSKYEQSIGVLISEASAVEMRFRNSVEMAILEFHKKLNELAQGHFSKTTELAKNAMDLRDEFGAASNNFEEKQLIAFVKRREEASARLSVFVADEVRKAHSEIDAAVRDGRAAAATLREVADRASRAGLMVGSFRVSRAFADYALQQLSEAERERIVAELQEDVDACTAKRRAAMRKAVESARSAAVATETAAAGIEEKARGIKFGEQIAKFENAPLPDSVKKRSADVEKSKRSVMHEEMISKFEKLEERIFAVRASAEKVTAHAEVSERIGNTDKPIASRSGTMTN